MNRSKGLIVKQREYFCYIRHRSFRSVINLGLIILLYRKAVKYHIGIM